MKKFMTKLITALYEQAWTIAGTILVLITLSGDIQTWGIKISVITLIIVLFGAVIKKEMDDSD
jgi:uncharacterized membrane protein